MPSFFEIESWSCIVVADGRENAQTTFDVEDSNRESIGKALKGGEPSL